MGTKANAAAQVFSSECIPAGGAEGHCDDALALAVITLHSPRGEEEGEGAQKTPPLGTWYLWEWVTRILLIAQKHQEFNAWDRRYDWPKKKSGGIKEEKDN